MILYTVAQLEKEFKDEAGGDCEDFWVLPLAQKSARWFEQLLRTADCQIGFILGLFLHVVLPVPAHLAAGIVLAMADLIFRGLNDRRGRRRQPRPRLADYAAPLMENEHGF
jgi:hypothetical protein